MPEFDEWVRQIDSIIEERIGLNTGDLEPDSYHGYEWMYVDGMSPDEAARAIMSEWLYD